VKYTLPNGQTVEQDRHFFIKREASTDLPFAATTPAEGSTVTLSNFRPSDRNGETTISGEGKTGGVVKVWNYHTKDRLIIKGEKPEDRLITVDENGKWSGVAELRNQDYAIFIEYFAPGADLDGEATESFTRSFTAVAPAGE
ncbi:hypothetical protein ACTJKO_15720, partial [Curtobacterium sp. 22159]|uniref:hypothetical protein n=1 Tax=Curtobacterium sp. 22159 TaxID=3453882 RepID=UPI003F83B8F6